MAIDRRFISAEIPMSERAEIVRKQSRAAEKATLLAQAQAQAQAQANVGAELGGRFAALRNKDQEIIGARGMPQYPRMPAGNPWASDPVPAEPPLGYAINAPIDISDPAPVPAPEKPADSVLPSPSVGPSPARPEIAPQVDARGLSPTEKVDDVMTRFIRRI